MRFQLSPRSSRIPTQPHRLLNHKAKFTKARDSMKEEKRAFNHAARSRARDAIRRGDEPEPEWKDSVRWQHW